MGCWVLKAFSGSTSISSSSKGGDPAPTLQVAEITWITQGLSYERNFQRIDYYSKHGKTDNNSHSAPIQLIWEGNPIPEREAEIQNMYKNINVPSIGKHKPHCVHIM